MFGHSIINLRGENYLIGAENKTFYIFISFYEIICSNDQIDKK